MKRIVCALLLCCLLLCACAKIEKDPPFEVYAVRVNAGEGSIVIQPRIRIGITVLEQKINAKIKQDLTKRALDIKNGFEGASQESFHYFITGKLLTIIQDGSFYSPGAAHETPYRTYLNIDLKTGSFYSLSDLFKKDTAPELRKILREKLLETLKQDWLSLDVPLQAAQFYLKNHKLTVVFSPYDVAAYALGYVQIEIPFEELSDIIDYNSAILRAYDAYFTD